MQIFPRNNIVHGKITIMIPLQIGRLFKIFFSPKSLEVFFFYLIFYIYLKVDIKYYSF